ncbi:MAG TPA: hypothetical protein VGF79_05425 [Bacteroidia bacterium]|jgi:hypothetical protein
MKKATIIICSILGILAFRITAWTNGIKESGIITFYKVPLVCGAAPEIGCGSRLKPLFIDTDKEKQIKETWSNRQGTVIAVVWNEGTDEDLIQSLFKKHDIEAKLISENSKIKELNASMMGKDKWYKGMEVDQLSIEEAGVIATDLTTFAKDSGLINEQEAGIIKKQIEDYFKKELVIVRTNKELGSQETQDRWRKDGYEIYAKNIGKERADKVAALFAVYFSGTEACDTDKSCSEKEDDCCKKK